MKVLKGWVNTVKKADLPENTYIIDVDKEDKIVVNKENIKPIFLVIQPEKIYCRYCGKQREASGEFCSMCGRSSHPSSTTVKKCILCKATMSEDSEFCANCGQKF
jgi:predicted amidophosphoribosyltransferase